MKSNVIVGFESCILLHLDRLSAEKGVSRSALIRAAVAEYIGVPHNELDPKPAPVKKEPKPKRERKPFAAYAGGQYLGVFATKEEAEEAKRNATRQKFYYVVRTVGGLLEFEVLDDPGENETYLEIEVFKHHAARRREWEETAAQHSGKFKDTETVWEKLREFFGEEADKAEKQGCVVSVVVA